MKKTRILALLLASVGCLGLSVSLFHSAPVSAAARPSFLASSAPLVSVNTPAQAPAATPAITDPGAAVYEKQCAICHGEHREGILPGFPPLLGIKHQLNDAQIGDLLVKGKGRMPAFNKLPSDQVASLLKFLGTAEAAPPLMAGGEGSHMEGLAEAGGGLFQQNCAFCHGRDAQGGETGPDLTQSKLVLADLNGDKITPVIREGRLEKKMPAFNFSSQELAGLVAFIHAREKAAASQKGGRRGVTPEDLQTGNAAAGKAYFNGAGGCSKCHSATGDLAGIANRYQGLHLEERMLYPDGAKQTAVVTLPSGEKVSGVVAYHDEFTIGLHDASGTYRSWPTTKVKFTIDDPAQAHVDQFPKYTDADIHNLMAYLQTLR